ncbi:MAG: RNA polymerase factor sigma-54 [Intestinimonas sp.]|jgi:RNA polymerase sigma-54 factor|nr:RNA polymerase factor sigma-54 [Intestinimonas sp.]
MELDLSIKQTQTLSPQMMQSMAILQMGSQELLEYIEEQVQENPVLETSEIPPNEQESNVLQRKLEWLESTDAQNRYYYQQDSEDQNDPISNYGTTQEVEDNLYLYVASQLSGITLEKGLKQACSYLIESLDQNGWLDESVEDLASQIGCPTALMEQALHVVQSLEPAGIAARGLSECLVLQLKRRGGDNTLALAIARDYLDPLSKNRYAFIAKSLNATCEQTRAACEQIRSLNPRPGTGFSARENLTYINPDIFVINFPDYFEVLTNDYFFPNLSVSNYYCRMLRESSDNEVRDYLTGKVRQAKWVVHSIEQRRSTLMKCAETLLQLQQDFFRHGHGHLHPMTLADVAGRIGVHESTVSRAVKDKYLQCSNGVYPLNYFFSRSLGDGGGDTSSPDFAKAILKKLIAEENKKKPLSDQKLCQIMAERGCTLSRRTVAKYRDELHIPCTTGRKQYE